MNYQPSVSELRHQLNEAVEAYELIADHHNFRFPGAREAAELSLAAMNLLIALNEVES